MTRVSSSINELEIIIPELENAPPAKSNLWTEREVAILRKYYGKKDTKAIARYLNRSVPAIQDKAFALGITRC